MSGCIKETTNYILLGAYVPKLLAIALLIFSKNSSSLKCQYDENVCFSFPLFITQMYVIGLDKCELL